MRVSWKGVDGLYDADWNGTRTAVYGVTHPLTGVGGLGYPRKDVTTSWEFHDDGAHFLSCLTRVSSHTPFVSPFAFFGPNLPKKDHVLRM